MSCEAQEMAKKPAKKPGRTADRHRSGFMVRLPEAHRAALEALQKKHRRTLTQEVQIALEKHYREEGVELPPPGV